MASASRVISAKPLVIRAAKALLPRPNPWQTPAPMATTFLTAPPISTPIGSELVYSRKVAPEKAFCTAAAAPQPVDATTSAVGSPRATSFAKVGPESTETLGVNLLPTTCSMTCDMRSREPVSSPFVALTSSIDSSSSGNIRW